MITRASDQFEISWQVESLVQFLVDIHGFFSRKLPFDFLHQLYKPK